MTTYEEINSLPIQKVLEDHGVELSGFGDNLFALSPFRETDNIKSFTVSISRNTFKDWKLDVSGGPVKFICQLLTVDGKTALKYLREKYFEAGSNVPFVKLVKPVKGEQKKLLDIDVVDKAYNIFLGKCSLTEEDRTYLKSVRHLTDEEIEVFGFKSFPRRTIKQFLCEEFKQAGIDPLEIPGFFQYPDEDIPTFAYYVGILIPIRDIQGRIQGLQIRKRNLKTPTDKRYVWFSSAFAINRDGEKQKYLMNGRGPGAPIGFVEGRFKQRSVTTLFITEGFFKALAIRSNLGSPSLTIQGITNWKDLKSQIIILKDRYPKLNRIIFALDSDFITNLNVGSQMVKMAEELKDLNLNLFSMLWPIADGKGVDDLIENHSQIVDKIFLMSMNDFKSCFENFEKKGKELILTNASDEIFSQEYLKCLALYGWPKA